VVTGNSYDSFDEVKRRVYGVVEDDDVAAPDGCGWEKGGVAGCLLVDEEEVADEERGLHGA
jgi:hypothetical protein